MNYVEELNEKELIAINGGGENMAWIFGRVVGCAIGGPLAGLYYGGCDAGWW